MTRDRGRRFDNQMTVEYRFIKNGCTTREWAHVCSVLELSTTKPGAIREPHVPKRERLGEFSAIEPGSFEADPGKERVGEEGALEMCRPVELGTCKGSASAEMNIPEFCVLSELGEIKIGVTSGELSTFKGTAPAKWDRLEECVTREVNALEGKYSEVL
jgi:hypothetical protein